MFVREATDVVVLPEDKRVMFRIPVQNMARLKNEIERLSKRSEKAGGWTIDLTVFGRIMDKKTGKEVYEVFMDAPEVALEGHTFLARLDHSQETGNIIRKLPGAADLPAEYRTVAPKCDHCKINRLRRDTFILRKDSDGSLIQLGSSCMQEFFKTDPRAIMRLAEVLGYAREAAEACENIDEDETTRVSMRDLRYLPTQEYFLNCAAVMREERARSKYGNGFVSAKAARNGEHATKRAALFAYYDHRFAQLNTDAERCFQPEDYALVAQANLWVEKLIELRDAGKPMNDFLNNVLVVGESSFIEKRAIGIAAAVVGCAERGLRDIEQREKPVVRQPIVIEKPKPLMLGNMLGIMSLFTGSKLQNPKVAISFPDTGEIVLSVATSSPEFPARFPGSINVKTRGAFGEAKWFGRIHLDGRWEPAKGIANPVIEAALVAFAADPAKVAAEYGHRTGNCCFCRKKLTDERSAHMGYGETCAHNFRLPYISQKEMTALKKSALEAA